MVQFRRKSRIKPEFNMASMTDMIFLLLIFFMLTSKLVEPTAVPVSLPSTKEGIIEVPQARVTITPDGQFYINTDANPVPKEQLESKLQETLQGEKYEKGDRVVPVVVLYADKSSAVEHVVFVAGIANELGAKVSLATEQEQ